MMKGPGVIDVDKGVAGNEVDDGCDGVGRPVLFVDVKGVSGKARVLIAGRGYDSDKFRPGAC